MNYFHLQRLIDKYSNKFTAILPQQGSYDDSGEYVKGEPKKVVLYGAILNISDKKIYNSNGTLTTEDRQLYYKGKLTNQLLGAKILYNGRYYSVESETDNSIFTGVSTYTLKYVSSFNQEGIND